MSFIEPTLLPIIQLAQSFDETNNQLAKQLVIGQKINKLDFCWQVATAEISFFEHFNFSFHLHAANVEDCLAYTSLIVRSRFLNVKITKMNLDNNYYFRLGINLGKDYQALEFNTYEYKNYCNNKISYNYIAFFNGDFQEFKKHLVCRIAWELFRVKPKFTYHQHEENWQNSTIGMEQIVP
jgi:hypothetical protein